MNEAKYLILYMCYSKYYLVVVCIKCNVLNEFIGPDFSINYLLNVRAPYS